MTHDREAGRVASWDGERGEIARLAQGRGELSRLTFTRADLIEGTPGVGQRCTYTPGREGRALHVRAKGESC